MRPAGQTGRLVAVAVTVAALAFGGNWLGHNYEVRRVHPAPGPAPAPAPAPVKPVVPSTTRLKATLLYDRTAPVPDLGLFLAHAASLESDLATENCDWTVLDVAGSDAKAARLDTVFQAARTPLVLLIQAEGIRAPVLVDKLPDSPPGVLAAVRKLRGKA